VNTQFCADALKRLIRLRPDTGRMAPVRPAGGRWRNPFGRSDRAALTRLI
jgi:hypothetical protein